jgi:hypothetical protein
MYRDCWITFVRTGHGDEAYVWHRSNPGGRQRRLMVACYRFEDLGEDPGLEVWLQALAKALPDSTPAWWL